MNRGEELKCNNKITEEELSFLILERKNVKSAFSCLEFINLKRTKEIYFLIERYTESKVFTACPVRL